MAVVCCLNKRPFQGGPVYVVTVLCFAYRLSCTVLQSSTQKRNFTLKITYREGVSLVGKAFALDSGGYEFIACTTKIEILMWYFAI